MTMERGRHVRGSSRIRRGGAACPGGGMLLSNHSHEGGTDIVEVANWVRETYHHPSRDVVVVRRRRRTADGAIVLLGSFGGGGDGGHGHGPAVFLSNERTTTTGGRTGQYLRTRRSGYTLGRPHAVAFGRGIFANIVLDRDEAIIRPEAIFVMGERDIFTSVWNDWRE